MRPNVPFAQALAVLVVASLAAAPVATAAGDDAPQTHDYRFSWNAFTFDAPDASGNTEEGASTNATLPLDQANVTALRFKLTWQDKVGEGDTLRMVVFDPDGEERARASDTQANGTLEVLVRVQEAPPGTVTVRADSDAEAWAVFRSDYPPSFAGNGEWRVEVTVVEADDEEGGLVGIGGKEDPGQAWNLTVDGGAYVGVLEKKMPVEDPEDEPPTAPDEMPPPDRDADNETTLPEEATGGGDTGILASKGAQSVLVVAAAAIGIAAALLVARKSGGAGA